MLIQGKEKEFWTYFMESECYNPISISREAIAEWIDSIKAPGGLRGVLETYRADLVNRKYSEMGIWGRGKWENGKFEHGNGKCANGNGETGQINAELRQELLTLPVMTIGAPEFFGHLVREEMLLVAENVGPSYIFEECGHSLALEAEDRLAEALKGFFLGES